MVALSEFVVRVSDCEVLRGKRSVVVPAVLALNVCGFVMLPIGCHPDEILVPELQFRIITEWYRESADWLSKIALAALSFVLSLEILLVCRLEIVRRWRAKHISPYHFSFCPFCALCYLAPRRISMYVP